MRCYLNSLNKNYHSCHKNYNNPNCTRTTSMWNKHCTLDPMAPWVFQTVLSDCSPNTFVSLCADSIHLLWHHLHLTDGHNTHDISCLAPYLKINFSGMQTGNRLLSNKYPHQMKMKPFSNENETFVFILTQL